MLLVSRVSNTLVDTVSAKEASICRLKSSVGKVEEEQVLLKLVEV